MDSETKMNVANALVCVSIISCTLAFASIIGMLCISTGSPKEMQTNIQVDVLAILVTILLGWNIYSIIDIKSIKKETNEQIKESSLRVRDEIKRELEAGFDSKFKHFETRIEDRFQKERALNVYLEKYKYAFKLSKENNEEAFRIFMSIAANCDSLDDGVTNEALMRAHEIASSVIYGDEKTKKSYIDAVNKLRIERQKQFYKMARKFMDKYMEKPLLPNSLFDKEDLEELSKFIDEKYNASNRQ